MQTAVPQGVGAMAALMPVSARDAEEICRLAAEQQARRVCQVANYNSSKQVRSILMVYCKRSPAMNSRVHMRLVRL